MSIKYFPFLFYAILISLIIISSQKENARIEGETRNAINPYLILQIPPWSKFKDVKKRYNQLLSDKKNNIERIQLIQKAYNIIEDEFKNNKKKDKTFFQVLKATIKQIILYESLMIGIILLTWLIYRFNTLVGWMIVSFVGIDKIIPHVFNTMLHQYIFSFVFGIFLYFRNYFFSFISIKKIEEENNHQGDNGMRKRKRFKKVE